MLVSTMKVGLLCVSSAVLAAEAAGVIPAGTQAAVTPGTLAWDSLTDEEKRL